jgi:putative ABC transport system ATP-binding protein
MYIKTDLVTKQRSSSPLLRIENIEKIYGTKNNTTRALHDVNINIYKGEFIAIMGASGSGKTTLLNCISTIDTVTSGQIYLDSQDITKLAPAEIARFRRENLGFIFQDFNLLDTLTIEENIALVLTINGTKETEIPGLIKSVATKLGIEDVLNKFPYQVSGGQKQRCACARAMVNNQQLVLADEPTGALDSKSAQALLEVMKYMNKEDDATILMVTHDPFSASYADRIMFLKDGEIFNEIIKNDKSRKEFYNEILDVLSLLGGDMNDVR